MSKLTYAEKTAIVKEMIGVDPKYLIPCGLKFRLDLEAMRQAGESIPTDGLLRIKQPEK